MQSKVTPIKIAVLRFSSIGDIVLISPILRALQASNTYSVHFVTKRAFSQVNLHNKNIKKHHLFDKDPREILSDLKAESFEFIVDLQKNLRSRRLVRLLNVKSATFPKLNVKKWMLVYFKWDSLPDIHIVDRYFEAIQSLDYKRDGQGLDMYIGEQNHVNTEQYGLKALDYTVVVLGAALYTKRIPEDILKEILAGIDGKVALIGGPAEAQVGHDLALLDKPRITNFCGKTNLQQSASIVKQSAQVVSADTGMMHIAAAFQKKIVVLWGNTVPKLGMYPYYGDNEDKAHYFEVPDLSCRPCSKIGFKQCPKGHFDCMKKQDTKAIIKVLKQL